MVHSEKKHRIIFIDLMRAFAVLQMVQGHTIDVLLSSSQRNLDNPFFAAWLFMRGMTAPIFLFSAGTVFTYLLRLNNQPFKFNPRIYKGIKRFLLLVFLGYMLRYPTSSVFDFSGVTESSWQTFLAVDVLQLIGFGILYIMILAFIAEKTKLNDYLIFFIGAMLNFILFPIFDKINWTNFLPVPIAGYFYKGTGSNFPLFPWAGFVVGGAILGSYLAKNPMVFKTAKFSYRLIMVGAFIIIIGFVAQLIESTIYGNVTPFSSDPHLIFTRLGFVIILNGIVSFLALKVDNIPRILILIGRNTLLIYIVHLMILYGSAWNPGLDLIFGNGLDGWTSVGFAVMMISLMTFMVYLINKFKIRNKELVT
jgi:uncharacterized membrane protein